MCTSWQDTEWVKCRQRYVYLDKIQNELSVDKDMYILTRYRMSLV
jgi:hypothetical protein